MNFANANVSFSHRSYLSDREIFFKAIKQYLLQMKQFDHYLHVGGVGRATFTSPVAIAFNRNLRRWHRTALETRWQDDKMTRWQDDKMTTQDCPGNKACDPFALKFISYCCSYISIEWLTDSENLLPTLNHTFKSWSRDFSWWRKNYCFLLNLFIHTFPLPNCFSKWFAMFIFVNAVLTVAPVHTVRVFCAFLGRRITCDGGGDDGKHFFETFLFSRGGEENV